MKNAPVLKPLLVLAISLLAAHWAQAGQLLGDSTMGPRHGSGYLGNSYIAVNSGIIFQAKTGGIYVGTAQHMAWDPHNTECYGGCANIPGDSHYYSFGQAAVDSPSKLSLQDKGQCNYTIADGTKDPCLLGNIGPVLPVNMNLTNPNGNYSHGDFELVNMALRNFQLGPGQAALGGDVPCNYPVGNEIPIGTQLRYSSPNGSTGFTVYGYVYATNVTELEYYGPETLGPTGSIPPGTYFAAPTGMTSNQDGILETWGFPYFGLAPGQDDTAIWGNSTFQTGAMIMQMVGDQTIIGDSGSAVFERYSNWWVGDVYSTELGDPTKTFVEDANVVWGFIGGALGAQIIYGGKVCTGAGRLMPIQVSPDAESMTVKHDDLPEIGREAGFNPELPGDGRRITMIAWEADGWHVGLMQGFRPIVPNAAEVQAITRVLRARGAKAPIHVEPGTIGVRPFARTR